MTQRPAFSPKQSFTALPELTDRLFTKGIQRSGQIGLAGKLTPSPGLGQGQIRSQPSVHLIDSPTTGQDTDQHIEHLVTGLMVDFLDLKL